MCDAVHIKLLLCVIDDDVSGRFMENVHTLLSKVTVTV
jgi:hypothetical protein